MRYEKGNPANLEVRECEVTVGPITAAGMSDPVYTECNAVCGDGTRMKYVRNFDTGETTETEEACNMGACPVINSECPIVVNPN